MNNTVFCGFSNIPGIPMFMGFMGNVEPLILKFKVHIFNRIVIRLWQNQDIQY